MVVELAAALKKSELVEQCIVVDSGDNHFEDSDNFRLVRSSHKNQPYQRFLGYRAAKPGWLLYLDDDMEPLTDWDRKLSELLADKGSQYRMFALCFRDKHDQSYLQTTEKSVFSSKKPTPLVNALRWITGYPILPEGRYGANGVKGASPANGGEVEYVSGGAFIGHKDVLYRNFNPQLFNLYDKRLGKGEDGIMGFTTCKETKIYYYPQPLFLHNDQGNSVYTRNDYQFNKLVAFSRAYLSLEYYRLNNGVLLWARWLYFNYSFWRLVGMGLNLILKPTKRKWYGFKGYLNGSSKGIALKFHKDVNKLRAYWDAEVAKDLETLDLKPISQVEGKK